MLDGQMLVHLCLFVLLSLISLMSHTVYICRIIFEQINDDDDDDDDMYLPWITNKLCRENREILADRVKNNALLLPLILVSSANFSGVTPG